MTALWFAEPRIYPNKEPPKIIPATRQNGKQWATDNESSAAYLWSDWKWVRCHRNSVTGIPLASLLPQASARRRSGVHLRLSFGWDTEKAPCVSAEDQ